MKILLANPRGFCAGVNRAISIVEHALETYSAPIYVRHEIVHNRYVINNLRERGVIFIENIEEVPDDAILIFSAHGVSQSVRSAAKARKLTILFDATCPLVAKVHMEVVRASHRGMEVILIGHAGHPEVEGTMGQYNNPAGGIYLLESLEDIFRLQVKNENNLCFVTQTTLSVYETSAVISALRQRFPRIIGPHKDDICFATVNRQEATRNLLVEADIVLVVGSKNSSNSNRLVELVTHAGKQAKLVDSAEDIQKNWLDGIYCVGVTAGASVPNILIKKVVQKLQKFGGQKVVELNGLRENIVFGMPKYISNLASSTDYSP